MLLSPLQGSCGIHCLILWYPPYVEHIVTPAEQKATLNASPQTLSKVRLKQDSIANGLNFGDAEAT